MDPASARRREGIAMPLFLVALLIALGALGIMGSLGDTRRLVANEEGALGALRLVAAAQREHQRTQGSFAWIEDLEAAGRISDLRVEPSPEGRSVSTGPYRIDVLLPSNRMRLVAQGGAPPDAALVRRHFVLIARPRVPEVDGYRLWYLDESDALYAGEGVIDPEMRERNALPDAPVLPGAAGVATSRIAWQRVAP